jgi:hypothetical protein
VGVTGREGDSADEHGGFLLVTRRIRFRRIPAHAIAVETWALGEVDALESLVWPGLN